MATRHVVFIDTQTLLHYQWLDQIDWCGLLSAPSIDIMLAPVVISELDKHKYSSPRKKIRERARDRIEQIFRTLSEARPDNLRENVALRRGLRESLADLASHGLDSETNDDRLIGTIIQFREKNSDLPVVFVTDDLGLKLKARDHNIDLIEMPENYQLAEEPDSAELQVQQLRAELQQLKNRLPNLRLSFTSGDQHLRLSSPQPFSLSEADIASRVEAARKEYPAYQVPAPARALHRLPNLSAAGIEAAGIFSRPSDTEITRYEKDRGEYFKALEEYWKKFPIFQNRHRLTVELGLILANNGTAPADDISILLHVPDQMYVGAKRPKIPEAPDTPVRPRMPFDLTSHFGSFPQVHDPTGMARMAEIAMNINRNASPPSIRRSNSFDVEFTVKRLVQHRDEALEPLYITFVSFETAKPFAIDYRLSSASLPQPVGGKLHIVVET